MGIDENKQVDFSKKVIQKNISIESNQKISAILKTPVNAKQTNALSSIIKNMGTNGLNTP